MTSPAEPDQTALLVLDYQVGMFEEVPGAEVLFMPGTEGLPLHTAKVSQAAKAKGVLLCFVSVGFRPGYPEIGPRAGAGFQMVRSTGLLIEGSPAQIVHPALEPADDDLVVTKHRFGAFEGTHLDQALRSRGVDTIAIAGVSTRGAVLSAVRTAADRDYQIVVLSDCCADNDKESHEILLQKVFPMQADVMTSTEWLATLGGRSS